MAAGAVSLRKSHDIVILSFCNIVKGQAKYISTYMSVIYLYIFYQKTFGDFLQIMNMITLPLRDLGLKGKMGYYTVCWWFDYAFPIISHLFA